MRIDKDYLKRLLEAFLDSETPSINLEDFQRIGLVDNEHIFVFHMKILEDQNLIEQMDGDRGFGLTIGADGNYHWSVLPLRLTARGQDFATEFCDQKVWNALKSNVGDIGIEALVSVSKELFSGFLKNGIETLLKP